MGIETLNTAARAAGFAMASAGEETATETKPEAAAWRPGEAILLSPNAQVAMPKRSAPSVAGWVKGLFGMSGRGAPA
jgi:hypothetical protein